MSAPLANPVATPVLDEGTLGRELRTFYRETIATAKCALQNQARYRGWFVSLSLNPFFLFAPYVFLIQTLVGPHGRFSQQFIALSGYSDPIAYTVVPLIGLGVVNTAFSWVGQLIRIERQNGTLERVLLTARFPSSLFLGRALAHALFVLWFVTIAAILSWLFLGLRLHANVPAGIVLAVIYLALVYGMAFVFASFFLWLEEASTVQWVIWRFGLYALTGATFPIAILPGWLQVIAKLIPLTWLFDLQRRALLRAEPLGAMLPELALVVAMTVAVWTMGFVFLRWTLTHARRTGNLGRY